MRSLLVLLILLPLLCVNAPVAAQCRNWSAQAVLTSAGTCATTGTVTVVLTGPDVANLSSIQYGMPLAPNNYAAPLGTSPTFTALPPGSYRFSAVGMCNGVFVGRNTSLYVPGGYLPPIFSVSGARSSLSCGATGAISASVSRGLPPFQLTITAAPASYSGPRSIRSSLRTNVFDQLPPGSYTVTVTDSCQTTLTQTVVVGTINEASLPVRFLDPYAVSCDSFILHLPSINGNIPGWAGYTGDTGFKTTISISGVQYVNLTPVKLTAGSVGVRLPPGKTIRDCYGQTVTYSITMPCGLPVTRTQTIPVPGFLHSEQLKCSQSFDIYATPAGFYCSPVQFSFRNVQTNQLYGPYGTNIGGPTASGLPVGTYIVTMTTGDGYTMSGTVSVAPVSANPYTVSVINGSSGIQGFAGGFQFSASGSTNGYRTVELFSGPAGYYYTGQWGGSYPYSVQFNSSGNLNALLFPAGTYVWKITDDCGVYFLTVQVTANDLYRFVIDSVSEMQTCQGLQITPWVRSWRNGVLQQNTAYVVIGGAGQNIQMPSGTPFVIPRPGTYTVIATTLGVPPTIMNGQFGTSYLSFPNQYNATRDVTYARFPLAINMDSSQGFICPGAVPGTARIHLNGRDGFPFRGAGGSRYYQYALAAQGQGKTGPYIATNNTGTFTGFNGVVNALYDVKITDSCGDTAIRSIRILDLERAGLISGTEYVVCRADSVRLSALWLPNATYSWSGPNGFSSNVRQPLIAPLLPAHSGQYRVVVNTSVCSVLVRDTSVLAVNDIPPKPLITYACNPRPPLITVTNPAAGHYYLWQIGRLYYFPWGLDYFYGLFENGNSQYTYPMYGAGSVAAVAIDTLTGCQTVGDSIVFDSENWSGQALTISANRFKLCTGDTTTLVASGISSATAKIQWYRNGQSLAGATQPFLVTNQSGAYRVIVDGGRCAKDTSATVQVQVVSPPQVRLEADDTVICKSDTAFLHTLYATDYTYSWLKNDTTIPIAFDSSLRVAQPGRYSVIVSNGGCIVKSADLSISVITLATPTVSPAGDLSICPGQTIQLKVDTVAGVQYQWTRDSIRIPGATGTVLQAGQDGLYSVIASNPACPSVIAAPVRVRVLRDPLKLPPDTTICNDDAFAVPLTIDTGFTRIAWSTGATDRQILLTLPGIYWVRADHRCGSFTDTFRIYTYRDYYPAWPADTTICNPAGASVLRVPKILSNIRWNTGARGASIVIRAPGKYWVEGSGPCGMVSDTVDVAFCPPLIRDLGLPDDSICLGDCITPVAEVDNYPSAHYWRIPGARPDTGWGSHPGTFCFETAGRYEVSLRASNAGGSDSATRIIEVVQRPQPRFRDTSVIAPYRSRVVLPACAAASHADWYRNDSLICRDCQTLSLDADYYYSTYRCVVRNAACPDSCSYALRVIDIPHEIWLPDAFTPNGDGKNDRFGIITDNPNVQVVSFAIYNRWGQRVYLSSLNAAAWDGTFAGKPAEMGSYFWQLSYRILDKPEVVHFMKGDLTLIR